MSNEYFITSYCSIQDNKIILNEETIFETESTLFNDFSKKAYHELNLNYPKFFKMDNLSKLAFLSSESILNQIVNPSDENDIALIFANKSSSLDTDIKYQKSISDNENYFPSPAVFVYTLPNICLGEISIKFNLKSENCFFVFDDFNSDFMLKYANLLLETKKASKILCGWVEYYDENYKAFLYLVSNEGKAKHNIETLETLYNK